MKDDCSSGVFTFSTLRTCLDTRKSKTRRFYITLERAIFGESSDSEYHVKALLEVGFEYVCEKDGLLFFRRRK